MIAVAPMFRFLLFIALVASANAHAHRLTLEVSVDGTLLRGVARFTD